MNLTTLALLPILCQQPAAPTGLRVGPVYKGPMITLKGSGQNKPTIIVLALDGITSLQYPYGYVADELVKRGWMAASLDLPYHQGGNALEMWAAALNDGQNIVEQFKSRLSDVISGLIEAKISDPSKLVIMGVSRGGFMAFHSLIDERIKALVNFMPVTDLFALSEFGHMTNPDLAMSLRVTRAMLPKKPMWIESQAVDTRVNADLTFALVEDLIFSGYTIHLEVQPGAGHSMPSDWMMNKAVDWIERIVQ